MAGSRRTAARVTPGAISLSSSSHFPLDAVFELRETRWRCRPAAPGSRRSRRRPDRRRARTRSARCGSPAATAATVAPPVARMTSGASATNSAAYLRMRSASPAAQRVSIRTLRPSVQPNSCSPCRNAATRACPSGSSAASAHEHADAPHPLGLLRARRERPRRRRAAEQRDELAPPHSITSSARASSVGGTSRPSALAVLRLMTSSNLVACTTGRSAGFAPLRMRPA